LLDALVAVGGTFHLIEGLLVSGAQFGGQLLAIGDALLFAKVAAVNLDGVEGHHEVEGDLGL